MNIQHLRGILLAAEQQGSGVVTVATSDLRALLETYDKANPGLGGALDQFDKLRTGAISKAS